MAYHARIPLESSQRLCAAWRMSNDESRSPNDMVIRHSDFVILSSFGHSSLAPGLGDQFSIPFSALLFLVTVNRTDSVPCTTQVVFCRATSAPATGWAPVRRLPPRIWTM